MAFVLPEDVGTTRRKKMTRSRALKIWESRKGVCVTCRHPIDASLEDWFVEHIRALELGGSDEDANMGPAHVRCKPAKDAADHSAAAQAKRRKAKHLGIKNPDRKTIPNPPKTKREPRRVAADLPELPRRSLYQ